jgi:hypothetical protein
VAEFGHGLALRGERVRDLDAVGAVAGAVTQAAIPWLVVLGERLQEA